MSVALRGDDFDVPHLQQVVSVLSSKWSVAILADLAAGTRRFNELLGDIDGVSRRMLSATLRRLERDGLVLRHVYARVPARVDYELSDAGQALLVALVPLAAWEAQHRDELAGARAQFDRLESRRVAAQELEAWSRTQTPRIS
jgi:DNA-binding HxlR family transcriptional regulator